MDEQPPLGIPPEDWAATPSSVRVALLALLPLVPLVDRVRTLEAEVADLRAQLARHSGNSSKPPSSDPPGAPPRPSKVPRGRQRGGQPGHPGHHRPLLPPEQVDEIRIVNPAVCGTCATPLPADLPNARPPARRQVFEIPPIRPIVTEYQLRALTCPHCGEVTRATSAPDLPPGGYGPRAVAIANLLHGPYQLSDRETAQAMHDLFGLPMADGLVTQVEQIMSAALAPIYETIATTTRQQDRVHADETPWKQGTAGIAGRRKGWLWVMVTPLCTLFQCAPSRSGLVVDTMLGLSWSGILTSDRWSSYKRIPVARRQLCWAHLRRDLLGFLDYARDGPLREWAATALSVQHLAFVLWHGYRSGELDRGQLQAGMAPLQAAFHTLLEQGRDLPLEKARAFCRDLRTLEEALWTFVREPRVEPTNNTAERALRPAVLWRKRCFGTQSEAGSRYVERMLTVLATCRQQQRHLLTFLTQAVQALWAGIAGPAVSCPAPS